jgi:hypothetical protein
MKFELELAYWKSIAGGLTQPKIPIIPYIPKRRQLPSRMLEVTSAWKGIESILSDITDRFQLGTERCLEFGVEYGYSTTALSSIFTSVIGVDTFVGDKHTIGKNDIYDETVGRLSIFENIKLVRSDYRDWIKHDTSSYDLIHIDIIHIYADTFACGLWSASHSRCAIFHDTESFPVVKQAVSDIARRTGKAFYNFKESNGLELLV